VLKDDVDVEVDVEVDVAYPLALTVLVDVPFVGHVLQVLIVGRGVVVHVHVSVVVVVYQL
jgi:hypothetical protein